MKTTTEGCARLVEKVAQLVLSVVEEATQVDSLTQRMMEVLERLSRYGDMPHVLSIFNVDPFTNFSVQTS